jgi:protein SCO1/2
MTSTVYKQQYELNHPIKKLVSSKIFWLLFVAIVFTYPVYRSLNRTLPPELPVLFQLPEFKLQSQNNQPFGSKDLKGKAYIASFMFTSCPTICPNLMEKMQTVQKRVRGVGQSLNLVSFTVDPEHDSPQVLKQYAQQLKANQQLWTFLTGPKSDLKSLLIDGFKVPMGEAEPVEGFKVKDKEVTLFDIAHTEKLVLVDHSGRIRGYYSIDQQSLDKLMIDVGLLLNREAFKR